MRVRVLSNPRSGRGRGAAATAEMAGALRAAGHEVETVVVGGDVGAAGGARGGVDVVVVIGGDGTLHRALPELVGQEGGSGAAGAVYHVPMGTENLFARQFGMSPEPARVVEAIERGRMERIDVGVCNGVLFALMVSAGPDAGIVHRLAAARGSSIRKWTYAVPMAAEIMRPRLGPWRVVVDGREMASGLGVAIVANTGQYGMRLDPARSALMTDGLLDAVFVPCRSGVEMLVRMGALRLGRLGSVVTARGREIRVEGVSGGPVQMDGEPSGERVPLVCGVRAGALGVVVG